MSNLFDRAFTLNGYDAAGNVIISLTQNNKINPMLRVVFHITQHTSMINNIAEFTIFNCAQKTITQLLRSSYITFEAGYVGNTKLIFKGNVMNLFDQRPQPDKAHTIYCLDYIDHPAPINLITSKSMSASDVIKAVAGKTEDLIVMDKNLYDLPSGPLNKAMSFTNITAWQAFLKIGRLLNINIWQVNRVLYTSSKTDGAVPQNSPKVTINYRNGMLQSPVFDVANAGVNVQTLLNGQLIPGSDVIIETVNPQVQFGAVNYAKFEQIAITRGTWRIFQTDHIGDSRGQDWYSEIQGYSYQATISGVIPVNE